MRLMILRAPAKIRPRLSEVLSLFGYNTARNRCGLIRKNGHRCQHRKKAELTIEGLFAGHGIQDDLYVPTRALHQVLQDCTTETRALMFWENGHIANVSAVDTVRKHPTDANQFAALPHKAPIATVGECDFEGRRRLVSKRRGKEKIGEFLPINVAQFIRPNNVHAGVYRSRAQIKSPRKNRPVTYLHSRSLLRHSLPKPLLQRRLSVPDSPQVLQIPCTQTCDGDGHSDVTVHPQWL
jgi:hypothetical protein